MVKLSRNTLLKSVGFPLCGGLLAAFLTPLAFWFDMKEGLIAYLGFLAASVIQVMVVTANFLQSDKLNPSEARQLSSALSRQQDFWVGLLVSSVVALIFVIVGSALKSYVGPQKISFGPTLEYDVDLSKVVVFFIAFTVIFVFYRMFALIGGVLSLHRLRSRLVIDAAEREAALQAKAMQEEAKPTSSFVPPGYGGIWEPPKL